MKTNALHFTLLALILAGASATIGCSSFNGGSSDYVAPGGLSQDVSDLPDPNVGASARRPHNTTTIRDVATVPQRTIQESPERLLTQADSYFNQKRYYDASRLYKKYLSTPVAPTAPADLIALIHYRLGFVERKKMFFSEAAKEFKQAVDYAPQNNEYAFAYAKVSYEAGDYQTADRQFVALLNRDPSYPGAQEYYGKTLLESSNRTNALQPLTTAVGELQAYALLTDKYYEKGELEQAKQAEGQMLQIAARLGKQVPDLSHKPQNALASNPALGIYGSAQQFNTQAYGAYASQTPSSVQMSNAPSNCAVDFTQPTIAQIPPQTILSSNAHDRSLAVQTLTYNPLLTTTPNNIPTTENVLQMTPECVPTTESRSQTASTATIDNTESQNYLSNTSSSPIPITESTIIASVPSVPKDSNESVQTTGLQIEQNAFVQNGTESASNSELAKTNEQSSQQIRQPNDVVAQLAQTQIPLNTQIHPRSTPSSSGFSLSASSTLLQSLEENVSNAEQELVNEQTTTKLPASQTQGVPVFAPIPVVEEQVFALQPKSTYKDFAQQVQPALAAPNSQLASYAPDFSSQTTNLTTTYQENDAKHGVNQLNLSYAQNAVPDIQQPLTPHNPDNSMLVTTTTTTNASATLNLPQTYTPQSSLSTFEEEDNFAFATSGVVAQTSSPVTTPVPSSGIPQPFIPAQVQATSYALSTGVAQSPPSQSAAAYPNSMRRLDLNRVPTTPEYVALAPTNNIPASATTTPQATIPYTVGAPTQADVAQPVPPALAVPGTLPTNSLFNIQ